MASWHEPKRTPAQDTLWRLWLQTGDVKALLAWSRSLSKEKS